MDVDSNAEPTVAQHAFQELFTGNIDVLDEAVISGWVVSKDDPTTHPTITLSVDGRRIGETRANRHRPDLEDAGLGSGDCAFELAIPDYAMPLAKAGEGRLRVEVTCADARALMHEGLLGRLDDDIPAAAASLLRGCIDRLLLRVEHAAAGETIGTLPLRRACPSPAFSEAGYVAALYATPPTQCELDGTGGYRPSSYIAFTRDRMGLRERYNYEENDWNADELLIWYLEWYGLQRKPFKVPLSRSDIARCNELVAFPRCRYRISRFHHAYLVKYRPELSLYQVLNDEALYASCLYEWVARTCPEFNVEDVLVPNSYVSTLRSVPGHWKGKAHPINHFFAARVASGSDRSALDLSDPRQRAIVHLMAYVDSVQDPTLFHYLAPSARTELFELAGNDGRTIYRRLIDACLSDESVRQLDQLDLHQILATSLREHSYDGGSARYLTVGRDGHRHQCGNEHVPLTDDSRCAVQVIGPLTKTSGLGQAARLSAAAITATETNVNLVDFDLDNPAPIQLLAEAKAGNLMHADINLIHLNAEAMPLLAAYTPDVYENSYNIGYFFWELDSPAGCHSLAMRMLDEIWVSSEFGVSQYQPYCDIPVINVGMSFENVEVPDRTTCRERLYAEYGIEHDETVYLATFDSYSYVQRKNPRAVIDAFQHAFRNEEPVRLILKTQNRESIIDAAQHEVWRGIDALIADDPRILLVNRTFSYQNLMWFKGAIDCYVSLHRAEGWGFGMLEAMAIGAPVIATDYSGNLEFCKPEHCWLVSGKKRFLRQEDYIFVEPGQSWIDPSVQEASRCMREVFADPVERRERGRAGQAYVRQNFSKEAVAERYRSRLDTIRERLTTESMPA